MPIRSPRDQSVSVKRILHVVGYADRGGCETNCAVFIRYAPELKHDVIVLGEPGSMTEIWESSGATVSHQFLLKFGWFSFYRRFRMLVSSRRIDAAIIWSGIRVPLVVAGLEAIGCPSVIHAGNPFDHGWRVRMMFWVSAIFLGRPRSVSIIACSHHVARTLKRAPYFSKLPLEVCHNPIEIPIDDTHAIRFLAPGCSVRIGMVARLDPIKDHATLLAAFAVLLKRWPLAELHLAGDGVLRRVLEAQSENLGIASAVHFHGSVKDVPRFLRTLDLFCYFTTRSEGMGNALAEALACGVPALVSELPVLREVVGKSIRAARFVSTDPGAIAESIAVLLADVNERQRMSSAARQRARDAFAPGRVVECYLRNLQSVQ